MIMENHAVDETIKQKNYMVCELPSCVAWWPKQWETSPVNATALYLFHFATIQYFK
jgi:hypothetical protein